MSNTLGFPRTLFAVSVVALLFACGDGSDMSGKTSDAGDSPADAATAGDAGGDELLASKDIGPEGGMLATPEGLTVEVPAGAVGSMTKFSIMSASVKSDALADGVAGIGPAYRIGPEGVVFDKPVRITLPFDAAEIDPDQEVLLLRRPPGEELWQPLGAVASDATEVSGLTTELSTYTAAQLAPSFEAARCSVPDVCNINCDASPGQLLPRTCSGSCSASMIGAEAGVQCKVSGTTVTCKCTSDGSLDPMHRTPLKMSIASFSATQALYFLGTSCGWPCAIVIEPGVLPGAKRGLRYTQKFEASGGTEPYTFRVTAGALPPGLRLKSSGLLTGTTTTLGTYTFTVTATDARGQTASAEHSLTVATVVVKVSPSTLGDAITGQAYNERLIAGGGQSPYTFAITSGTLPSGLTLSTSGRLTGTPSSAGTSTFTVTATDENDIAGSKQYSLRVVHPKLKLSPSTLSNAIIGQGYQRSLLASGGTAPYTFVLTTGALPSGLILSSTGNLSGTPTVTGAFPVTLTVTDKNGASSSAQRTLNVVRPTITLAPVALPSVTVGTAYQQTVSASGGTTSYAYAVTSGVLPSGLTLSSAGNLSGTPTVSGSFPITVTATDFYESTGSAQYTVSVIAATITVTPMTLPGGTVGASYSQTIGASGGTTPYSFTVTGGTLPTGLTLSTGGTLSGTPSAAATYSFTVTATDMYSSTGSRGYMIEVGASALPTITSVSPSSGPPGTYVTITGNAIGSATAVTFNDTDAGAVTVIGADEISVVVPEDATTGVIEVTTPSGTAMSSGDFTVTEAPEAILTLDNVIPQSLVIVNGIVYVSELLSAAVYSVGTDGSDPGKIAMTSNYPAYGGLAVVGGNVYWSSYASSGAMDGKVGTIPVAGGDEMDLFTMLKEPQGMAADGTSLFWAQQGAGQLHRRMGGSDSWIDGEVGPTQIAVAGGYLYWSTGIGQTVRRIASDLSGTATTVIDSTELLALTIGYPSTIVVDGSTLYVAVDPGNSPGGDILRSAIDGTGAVTTPATLPANTSPKHLAIDGNYLYFSSRTTPGLFRVLKTATDAEPEAVAGPAGYGPLFAFDGDYLFYAEGNKVYRIAKP